MSGGMLKDTERNAIGDRVLLRLAAIAVPVILAGIGTLLMMVITDIRGAIEANVHTIAGLQALSASNRELTIELRAGNLLQDQLIQGIVSTTVDHEGRLRALETWMRTVPPR